MSHWGRPVRTFDRFMPAEMTPPLLLLVAASKKLLYKFFIVFNCDSALRGNPLSPHHE